MAGWILLALAILGSGFAIAGYTGAPYVPILKKDHDELIKLAGLKPGQTIVDLGAGDGYLLRAAARQGIFGIGYEINPVMVAVGMLACFPCRKYVRIHFGDFWKIPTPTADAIYIFLIPKMMARLDQKLTAELTRPTVVITYAFPFPHRKPVVSTKSIYVYQFPGRQTPAA